MAIFRVNVNARSIEHQGEDNDRLLTLLHDEGLTASKMGCGTGHCGACTVWIDGAPARSCDVTVASICATVPSIGSEVTTLEGLSECEPKLAQYLIDAFIAQQAAQCGYCSSGILMKAAALILNRNKQAEKSRHESLSEQEIMKTLDDHLCRCGSHRRVLRAVQVANERFAKI
jgi:nicotinate dehydrogenase subunit A